jgi:hypothetical protein
MAISDRGYRCVMMTGSNVCRIAAPISINRLVPSSARLSHLRTSLQSDYPLVSPRPPHLSSPSPRRDPNLDTHNRPIMPRVPPTSLSRFPWAKDG